MKQLHFIISLFLLFFYLNISAKFVNQNTALTLASNFFIKQYSQIKNTKIKDLEVLNTEAITYHNKIVYYIINYKNFGFVQISAEDAAYPILAYDLDNNTNTEIKANNYLSWVETYKKQIAYIRTNNLKATKRIKKLWSDLAANNTTIASGKSVDPLILCNWNQGAIYNQQCPLDINGPGGRVYAGCVAVAMAQIMYYYRYPNQGSGSHSYYHNVYGVQSADFGATTYHWNQMTNKISNNGNFEIARLLYHLGVSVNMGYSATGSGAYSGTAVTALRTYFNYQNSITLKDKDNYTYTQWVDMITNSIDAGIPLYYHGYDTQGGHAFNLDGYQGSDHFHFNWGWGGSYNGYYYLNALNPGSSSFANGQGAIFNFYPGNGYPYSCSAGNIITSNEGTIADGSGPQQCFNNLDCNWLIKPTDNIAYIKISFDRFDLIPGDTLFIYDRYTQDSLIAALSGSQIPNDINTEHGAAFINLKTNSTQKSSGFSLSYKSYFPVYCSGLSYYTDSIGTLSDGSDTNKYNNSTFCRWLIEPTNNYPVRIFFDNFDTEPNKDYVKIYDTDHTPAILLASYSGHSIPPSVTSTSGKMSIIFTSSSGQAFDGWSAHYISGPSVGIGQNKNSIFRIYPNPVSNLLYIENTKANNNSVSYIQIIGVDGRTVFSKKITKKSTLLKIQIPQLNSGLYFVKLNGPNMYESHKIIIK